MRLVMIDDELRRALDDPEQFTVLYGETSEDVLETARGVVEQTLSYQETIDATEPWCGYLCLRSEDGAAVGSGGFKGVPDDGGSVEIAYTTFAPFEGMGLGRETAASLCDIARAGGAELVVAHTLPEKNASTAILTRLGFDFVGEVADPEDGVVWRWEREP